jgi:tetratricopeptide (TPR) repeat protein
VNAIVGAIPDMTYLGQWNEIMSILDEVGPVTELGESVLIGVVFASYVYVQRGELDGARGLLDLASGLESSHDVQTRTVYQVARSPLLRAEGQFAEALAAGMEAWDARSEIGLQHQPVKEGLMEALEASYGLGDLDAVERLLAEILALRPGELTPYPRAQGARFGARLAAARRENDRVEPGFAAAERQFRELSFPFHLAVTLLEHGEWLSANGRADDAKLLLDEAREIFERLKARPWLERLDNVMPSSLTVS